MFNSTLKPSVQSVIKAIYKRPTFKINIISTYIHFVSYYIFHVTPPRRYDENSSPSVGNDVEHSAGGNRLTTNENNDQPAS